MATATLTSQAELEDYVGSMDAKALATALKDGSFKQTIASYVAKATEATQDEIKEQAQVAIAELLQDKKAAKTLNLSPLEMGPQTKYRPVGNDKAVGKPLDGIFNDIGEFTAAYLNHSGRNSRLSGDIQNKVDKVLAYQEKIPSEGGFLVPEEFRAELLRLTLETAVVRPRARVVPMSSSTLRFPAVDDTSHASSLYGGVVVYRTEEGAALTESTGAFGSIKLEATKQTAYAVVTNELVRDAAGGFTMYLEEILPEAIAWFEDDDFLNGTGVGEPLGSLSSNNGAIIEVSKEDGQAAATIVWENVVKMYARMLPSSLNRAVWVVSPNALPQLYTMGLIVGTGGGPTLIGEGQGSQTPPSTILGRPYVVTEKAPATLGTKGDISFVDFGYYLIGDRQRMEMASSEHIKFDEDKTAFRVIQRNDGRPWVQSALTPKYGGDTLSPFVQLATRS